MLVGLDVPPVIGAVRVVSAVLIGLGRGSDQGVMADPPPGLVELALVVCAIKSVPFSGCDDSASPNEPALPFTEGGPGGQVGLPLELATLWGRALYALPTRHALKNTDKEAPLACATPALQVPQQEAVVAADGVGRATSVTARDTACWICRGGATDGNSLLASGVHFPRFVLNSRLVAQRTLHAR